MRPLLLFLFVSPALGTPRAFVAAGIEGAVPSDRPVEARAGQPVRLFAVLRQGPTYFTEAPALRVRGRRVPARRLRPLADLSPHAIEWRLVEPRQHHTHTPPPNFGNPAYSNAVLFGPGHGRWLGYDTLEYHETPLPHRGPALTIDGAHPSHPRLRRNRGLGTIRYAVTIETADGVWSSPGAEATGRGGIAPTVARISYRAGDDPVGWLTSYFNVPNVFGSAGKGARHQAELHQGADCADVLVGALRKAGRRLPYTSVAGLYRHGRARTPKLWMDAEGLFEITDEGRGAPVTLRYGHDVAPGDLMVIDYAALWVTKRSWDHVGMLGPDAGRPGVVDLDDPLLHMGYLYGLEQAPLRRHGSATVQFIRMRR